MRGINADRSTMLHVVPHASIATCTNTLCSRELTDRQRRVEIRGWKSDTRSRGVGKLVEWQRQWRFISSLVQGRVTCHTLYLSATQVEVSRLQSRQEAAYRREKQREGGREYCEDGFLIVVAREGRELSTSRVVLPSYIGHSNNFFTTETHLSVRISKCFFFFLRIKNGYCTTCTLVVSCTQL